MWYGFHIVSNWNKIVTTDFQYKLSIYKWMDKINWIERVAVECVNWDSNNKTSVFFFLSPAFDVGGGGNGDKGVDTHTIYV